jgi:hypothetical protein
MKRIASKRGKAKLPGNEGRFVKLQLTKAWSAYVRSDLRARHRPGEGAKPKLLAHARACYVDPR